MKKGQKAAPYKLENHDSEEKGKEKKKECEGKKEEKRKRSGCTLIGYFGESFWPKKLFDGRGLFGSNVFKTPAGT